MIYFIRGGSSVKIGFVSDKNSLPERLANLQCGSPLVLSIAGVYEGDRETEQELHRIFAAERYLGEWFHMSERLVDFIETRCRPFVAQEYHAIAPRFASGQDGAAPSKSIRMRSRLIAVRPNEVWEDLNVFLDKWTEPSENTHTLASTFQKCLAAHWAQTFPGKAPPTHTALGIAMGKRYSKTKTGGQQCYMAVLKPLSIAKIDAPEELELKIS